MNKPKQEIDKSRGEALTAGFLMVMIVAAAIIAQTYYLGPKTELAENLVVVPGMKVDVEQSRAQFDAIQRDILANSRFMQYQKYSEWPLAVKKIPAGRALPFITE